MRRGSRRIIPAASACSPRCRCPTSTAACAEIEYAFDVLKADGVGLMTSVNQQWLGDRAFAPVMDELNRRKAVVYVHPTCPHCCRNLMADVPDHLIEFATDTTAPSPA